MDGELVGWLARVGLIVVLVALLRQARAETRAEKRTPVGFPFPSDNAISRP